MPAYKDPKSGKWLVKFSYKDWRGKTRFTTKRGFSTKRDALQYEMSFKMRIAGDMNMTFREFVEVYQKNRYPRIRTSTQECKDWIIERKLLPYFGDMRVADIKATDIIEWQNELMSIILPKTGKPYSETYLKTIHNQMNAIMNYAVRFYDLKENPVARAGAIGCKDAKEMKFWTLEEYKKFSEEMMEEPLAFYCFELLYWTGIREGELLALGYNDFDLEAGTVSITKTYQIIKGKPHIGPPKTEKGRRVVQMPKTLTDEIKDYFELCADKNAPRAFPITKYYLSYNLKKGCERSGVCKIRVHDLRHSHVSLLISLGYTPVDIGKRVGHESITITLRYAHMFPSVQEKMANSLDVLMEGECDEGK